jgi:glycine reductase complex component B subunit gamma
VLVTAIAPLAEAVGANRIVEGRAVPHAFGDPALPQEEEAALRVALLRRAVEAASTPVDGPTVFGA